MHQYQQHPTYFAQIAGGLEEEGAAEFREMGATDTRAVYRGFYFTASPEVLYTVSYASRLASRVLAPLVTFDCHSDRYLYRTVGQIDWSTFLTPDDTFAVVANVSNSAIRHSKFAALRVKDAVVDQFREATGVRPSIDTENPDLWIVLSINENRAVLSVSTSAGAMHRRGYRTTGTEAPMQETVAAAVVRFSGWQGERPLYDPMCGSGTLLAEALMHYARIPSGYLHGRFGFERLPDFDRSRWKALRKRLDGAIRTLPDGLIAGSDLDRDTAAIARRNLANLPGGDRISIAGRDYRSIDALEDRMLLINPPYGLRMGRGEDMRAFYRELGDYLKQRCRGSAACIYFGKREYLKDIGLHPSWKKVLVSGALDGRLALFELY